MEYLAAGLVLLSLAAISMVYKARAVLSSEGKSPSWIQAVLPACFVVDTLLKSALALSLMSSDLAPGPVASVWTVFLLGSAASLTFLFSQRVGDFACWCLVFVISLLFWGDVLYYRGDFLLKAQRQSARRKVNRVPKPQPGALQKAWRQFVTIDGRQSV